MRPTLFDVLEGHAASLPRPGARGAAGADEAALTASIAANLSRVLNTRHGSVPHLPGYGLPDPNSVLHSAFERADLLRPAIRQAVETYEPRLRRVRVDVRQPNPSEMRLTFQITGEIARGTRVRFEAVVGSWQPVEVHPGGG